MTTWQTIQVTASNQVPLIDAGDGPALIVNTDLIETLWLSQDYGFQPGAPNSVAVGPQQMRAFDGVKTVYGAIVPGILGPLIGGIPVSAITVQILPGCTDADTAIGASEVIPIYGLSNFIITGPTTAQTINSIFGTVTPVGTAQSWEFYADAQMVTPTVPFFVINFNWFESLADAAANTTPLWVDSIIITAWSSGAVAVHHGHGPCRGAYLNVTVGNDDPVVTAQLKFRMTLSARAAIDDLAMIEGNTGLTTVVTGYVPSNARAGHYAIGGYWTGTLAAASSVSLLANVYPRTQNWRFGFTGASTAYNYQMQTYLSATGVIGVGSIISHTAPADDERVYSAGNPPLIVKINNTDAANTLTYTVASIPQRTN